MHGERFELPGNLEGSHQPAPRPLVGGKLRDVIPCEDDAPRARCLLTGDCGKECALARAVGSRDAENFRLFECERYVIDGGKPAVATTDMTGLQDHDSLRPNMPLGL